jgi:hypothetical protein
MKGLNKNIQIREHCNLSTINFIIDNCNMFLLLGQEKKYVCLRSPDPPYFSAANPNLFNRQLFHTNFC